MTQCTRTSSGNRYSQFYPKKSNSGRVSLLTQLRYGKVGNMDYPNITRIRIAL